MKRKVQITAYGIAVILPYLFFMLPSLAGAPSAGLVIGGSLVIGGYTQISAVPVSAYEYDYTYLAVITNTGAPVSAVNATLKSLDPNIKVIDASLTFGDIPAKSSKVSQDTFTIRQDIRYPLDSSLLSWSISFLNGANTAAILSDPSMVNAITSVNGFQDSVVFTGLLEPTVVQFASDGRVFVAEKSGIIKVYDSLTTTTPTVFADLRTQVHNFGNRGLIGMALDPNFPTRPYVYVLYSYDAPIGAPRPAGAHPAPPLTPART